MKKEKITFLKPKEENSVGHWLVEQEISAGFPSPADDFKDIRISLDKELVKNSESTFYARVSGDSMINAGIYPGDTLIVDRSLKPKHNSIVIACIENEFTVKRLKKVNQKWMLFPENEHYKPMPFCTESDMVWGVVTINLHKLLNIYNIFQDRIGIFYKLWQQC